MITQLDEKIYLFVYEKQKFISDSCFLFFDIILIIFDHILITFFIKVECEHCYRSQSNNWDHQDTYNTPLHHRHPHQHHHYTEYNNNNCNRNTTTNATHCQLNRATPTKLKYAATQNTTCHQCHNSVNNRQEPSQQLHLDQHQRAHYRVVTTQPPPVTTASYSTSAHQHTQRATQPIRLIYPTITTTATDHKQKYQYQSIPRHQHQQKGQQQQQHLMDTYQQKCHLYPTTRQPEIIQQQMEQHIVAIQNTMPVYHYQHQDSIQPYRQRQQPKQLDTQLTTSIITTTTSLPFRPKNYTINNYNLHSGSNSSNNSILASDSSLSSNKSINEYYNHHYQSTNNNNNNRFKANPNIEKSTKNSIIIRFSK
jgi:hypothetical protein